MDVFPEGASFRKGTGPKSVRLNFRKLLVNCSLSIKSRRVNQNKSQQVTKVKTSRGVKDLDLEGTLFIDWGDSKMKGEFKTVRPYDKISFTWNNFSKELNKEMSTLVTITMKKSNGKSMQGE